MASGFKGKALFASGPHRFAMGRQGEVVATDFALGAPGPGTYALGLAELDVVVTGRLVAASEVALWVLRDAVTAELIHPPTAGTLEDGHGRAWTGMSFWRYEEGEVERGRVWSVGYTASFRKFAVL